MNVGGVALVWGPPRSGTTWLFNVVQAILDAAEINHATWVSGQRPVIPDTYQSLVVKSHQAELLDVLLNLPSLSRVYPIVILRDAEPTLQSLIRTQEADRAELIRWLENDLTSLQEALEVLPDAKVVREEWITRNQFSLVALIASYLGIDLPPVHLIEISQRFSKDQVRNQISGLTQLQGWNGDFDEFDVDSQWHANHIAPGGYRGVLLSKHERELIGSLQETIDQLTEEYSLLTPEQKQYFDAVEEVDDVEVATAELVLAEIKQRMKPRRFRTFVRALAGATQS